MLALLSVHDVFMPSQVSALPFVSVKERRLLLISWYCIVCDSSCKVVYVHLCIHLL